MSELRAIAKDLWIIERPQKFYGVEIGTKMTIARLEDGSLFIHSPVQLNPDLGEQLKQLGFPAHIIAPNCFHHLYIAAYKSSFPNSKIYAAPQLQEKRQDLRFDCVITSPAAYPWSQEIDHLICRGMPKLNEVVFLHKASKTLILTDLVFNFDAQSSLSARIFSRLSGIYGRLGTSWMDRLLFLRNKQVASESFQHILSWDFDRIIMAHGRVLDRGAKTSLELAMRTWVGES